jgi:hypothetical protein
MPLGRKLLPAKAGGAGGPGSGSGVLGEWDISTRAIDKRAGVLSPKGFYAQLRCNKTGIGMCWADKENQKLLKFFNILIYMENIFRLLFWSNQRKRNAHKGWEGILRIISQSYPQVLWKSLNLLS